MRLAFVTTSYPADEHDPSGHFVRAEVRARRAEGHEVVVVTPPPGGAFGWPGVAARVRAEPWRAIEAAAWVRAARRELRAHGAFDRVIAHWALPSAWIAHAAEAPLEVVSHGGDVRLLRALPGPVRGALVAAIAERACAWRFVSSALLGELLAALGAKARAAVERVARVEASPIEVPASARAAAAARRAELGGARVAVTVARLVASKRVDRVIEHAAAEGHALVVVGDGPERARLEALARARRVDARFVGRVPRDEALAWIGAADVLVHASEAEGLSTVIREAEALGVAVARL